MLESIVASDYRIRREILVDGVCDDSGNHGKFNWPRIQNTYNISRTWRLDNAEERAIQTILGVEFDYLLIVIWTLKEFDSGVEWTSIGLEKDLDGIDNGIKMIGA